MFGMERRTRGERENRWMRQSEKGVCGNEEEMLDYRDNSTQQVESQRNEDERMMELMVSERRGPI